METEENKGAEQNQTVAGSTPEPSSTSMDNTTLMGVLAYVGPLVIIPYLTAKENSFVKYHIKQGLVLVVIEVALWIIGSMVWGLWMILQIINIGLIVLSVLGIVNVIQKKEAELPLVGQYAKHFKI